MISNNLPQGMSQNTIPLMLGHPDPETLLTPELRDDILQVIHSPQAYSAAVWRRAGNAKPDRFSRGENKSRTGPLTTGW